MNIFQRRVLVQIPLELVPDRTQWQAESPAESLDEVLNGLWMEIGDEVFEKEYLGREHGLNTYRLGCRGPVCCAANRAHARKYSGHSATGKYLWLDPVIDYYKSAVEVARWSNMELAKQAVVNAVLLPELEDMDEKGLLKAHEMSEWANEVPA